MHHEQSYQATNGKGRRRVLFGVLVAVMIALITGIFSTPAQAQTSTTHRIKVGDTITDTLDTHTFAQVYAFDAAKGDKVSIVAVSKTRGVVLALLLNDSNGQSLSQVAALTSADVSIRNYTFAQDGTYYVTVLRATGVQGNVSGSFTLTLSGTSSAPASSPTVSLASGMSVALNWASTDDMTIEVRDPVGGAVNLNVPVIASGAQLTGVSNASCKPTQLGGGVAATPAATATVGSNQQMISWPKGSVASGSYEVLVYFKQSCPQGIKPLPFTVTVTVDGQSQTPIAGKLDAQGEVYVASFVLNSSSDVTVRSGGPNLGYDLAPVAGKISAPTALGTKTTATGTLNFSNPADTYTFTGKAGDIVSIAQSAINGGSLDSLLLLLDGSGNIITSNDDANQYSRDSLIANFALPADGTYTIVATRYAIANGGTEGGYKLALTRGQITISAATAPANATATPTGGTPVSTSTLVAGQPSGSIEVSVNWNSRADVRLWVRDPLGGRLYTDIPKSGSGGVLSETSNFACPTTVNPTNGPVSQDFAYWNTANPPTGTYEIRIWQESDCNDPTLTQFTLNVNVKGKPVFLIPVTDMPGPNKQSYLVTFSVDANGIVTHGNGGQVTHQFPAATVSTALSSASALAYNQTVTGQITAANKYNFYTFNAVKGDKITITMTHVSGTLDCEIYLFSLGSTNTPTQVTFNNGNTNNAALGLLDAQVVQTIPNDGTYVIVATRFGEDLGATTGSYTLALGGPVR